MASTPEVEFFEALANAWEKGSELYHYRHFARRPTPKILKEIQIVLKDWNERNTEFAIELSEKEKL